MVSRFKSDLARRCHDLLVLEFADFDRIHLDYYGYPVRLFIRLSVATLRRYQVTSCKSTVRECLDTSNNTLACIKLTTAAFFVGAQITRLLWSQKSLVSTSFTTRAIDGL